MKAYVRHEVLQDLILDEYCAKQIREIWEQKKIDKISYDPAEDAFTFDLGDYYPSKSNVDDREYQIETIHRLMEERHKELGRKKE